LLGLATTGITPDNGSVEDSRGQVSNSSDPPRQIHLPSVGRTRKAPYFGLGLFWFLGRRSYAGAVNDTQPRAVVAGASGFIGQRLARELRDRGYAVARIGRADADANWGDTRAIRELIDGCDLVINLAGKSVNCRYTEHNRREILRSRVETTRQIREAIAASARPPGVWLNASTATIFRYALDRPMGETDGELGTGFSSDIAREWERELFAGDLPDTRRIALRMAIVLGDGPATGILVRLARVGLGGPQIDGRWFPHTRYRGIGSHPTGHGTAPTHHSRGAQRFSWIHIDDVIGAIAFLIGRDDLSGAINLAAPQGSDNRTLMATLRRSVGARIGLPAFRWMLEPAMWLLRTEPELVLKSRWVVPERLTSAGFVFQWPALAPAVDDVVRQMSKA
jgi:NAD dependent epimerase/dehydratase family enzyme